MAPRDNNCPALPKLCTDPAMIHGEAMTLTYLCPEKTVGPSTVHVTVTATTTVTLLPTNNAPAIPSKNAPPPEEPTTTTTIKSTLTQYKTITVISKHASSSLRILTPPVITTSFSQGVPPPLPSSLALTPSVGNGTISSVSYTHHTISNSSAIVPTPFYPNITSHSGYAAPTLNIAREVNPTHTAMALSKGMADQTGVSPVALFLGFMAAVYLT
ncbi:uncharacterized protein K460DRAFT_358585 [Cucurbitaria berberidis CBS 394.84]|uniref:Uncharacterized protein n=1 Tax=Cucurbitaria berberidis CBS 394.84 TaxID=1168544 RepID=A0A9P4GAA4_9PLEO|nr:uncharacterized protein K460DRAFT_358585 [Cucurbitaria berberidis CBS 394.84]KAF1841891.1 hypothetical protein K460DRAFT_358585 [Cucurbitaria berberidis CBS 394.84]